MAFTLSGLDVHYLVREFRPLLLDAFLDKAYQGVGKRDVMLRMRSPRHGKQQLFFRVPDALFLTGHRFPWPTHPPGFCMQLRKRLGNAQLSDIRQVGFERVVELVFRRGEESWRLVVELFSKGNVILVDGDGVIRGVLDRQRWKGRSLQPSEEYLPPPQTADPRGLSFEEFSRMWGGAGRELVRFCAASLGLGGKYAEEVVARVGLDKFATSLDDGQLRSLYEAVMGLFERSLEPVVSGGDAAPFPLVTWPGAESRESFSGAVEEVVVAEKVEAAEEVAEKEARKVTDRYDRIIDQQGKKLEGYRRAAADNQRRGELIYERYRELSSLLEKVRSLQEEGGWDAVKEYAEEHGLPIKVNEKDGVISFEIQES